MSPRAPSGPRQPAAARSPKPSISSMPSVTVATAALLVYLLLLCPVPAGKDGSEFVLVLATLGLAHPTGYALYTLAGHLFVTLLHGAGASWAWAANAFSALGGAVALGCLHALATRWLAPRFGARAAQWLALLPVGAFALDPAWTSESTLAEVNSWHVAWVAAACLATWVVARELNDSKATRGATWRGMLGWGVVMGAGLVHHSTSVLFAIPLVVGLGIAARRSPNRGAWLAGAALGAAVPATLAFGYFSWRATHPAAVQWPAFEPGFHGLRDHVSGAGYRAFFGRFAPSRGQQYLLARHVYPWLLLAVAGAVATLSRRASRTEPIRVALAVAVLLQAAACFGYGVPDPAPYFLPPLAVGLVLLAMALAETAAVRRAAWVVVPALALGVLVTDAIGWGVARERTRVFVTFDALLLDMFTHIPRGRAFVVWDDDMAYRLRAFQMLEGLRAELVVVQPRQLSYPAERRRFSTRFGFDPLATLAASGTTTLHPVDEAQVLPLVDAITARLNASPLPVYVFLPQLPSVRMLRKSGGTPEQEATP